MARSHSRVLIAAGSLLALSACSEMSTAPSTPDRTLTPNGPAADLGPGDPSIIRHVMPAHAAAAHGGLYTGTVSGGKIFFRGGTVLQAATNVVSIYWYNGALYSGGPSTGTGTGAADGSLIGTFLRALGGSRYFNINTTYTDASNRKIANVVNYNGYWVNTTNVPAAGSAPTDANMIAMLQSGFNSGALTYDPNTLYVIFTGPNVNLGGGFGSQYCAYHTHGTVTINGQSKVALYSAMPYNQGNSGCMAQTTGPNGDAADPEVSVLAHEIEETTTDAMGNAWYDNRGYENADKCAWTWGTTSTAANGAAYNLTLGGKNWLVQRNWVQTSSSCSMSY